MGLWLEHRNDKGELLDRGRFESGQVTLVHMVEVNGDGSTSAPTFTLRQAIELCKLSSHLPADRRDWALRIDFND